MLRLVEQGLHAQSGMLVLMVLAISPGGPGSPLHDLQSGRRAGGRRGRVSLPVPAGLLAGPPPAEAILDGKAVPVQAKVVTRHPDGSIRRVMLSVPVDLPPQRRQEGIYPAGKPAAPADERSPGRHRHRSLESRAGDGSHRAAQRAAMSCWRRSSRSGPEPGPAQATVQVLDCGPQFVWLRYDRAGRRVEPAVRRAGLPHRRTASDASHPGEARRRSLDAGLRLEADRARCAGRESAAGRGAHAGPRPELALCRPRATRTCSPQITLGDGTPACVANPLALRQNRGTFEATRTADAVVVRSSRTEPVENLETQGLMIQEGAWRFSELAIAPLDKAEFAAQLDAPVYSHADWRAYDAVYRTRRSAGGETPGAARLRREDGLRLAGHADERRRPGLDALALVPAAGQARLYAPRFV